MSDIDWAKLGNQLAVLLRTELRGVLAGAEGDLHVYAAQIARGMVDAVSAGDEASQRELIAQAEVLVEINRLRVVAAGWHVVEAALDLALKTLAVAVRVMA